MFEKISPELCEVLQFFVGKVCTIVTNPMAMPLEKTSFADWFTVKVDGIDQEAIVGTDLVRNTKHVFFFPIIGIAEEQVIKKDNPDYDKIKKQAEERKSHKEQPTMSVKSEVLSIREKIQNEIRQEKS